MNSTLGSTTESQFLLKENSGLHQDNSYSCISEMYIKWKRSSFWQSYELFRRIKTEKAITVFVWDSLKVARKGSSAVCEKGSRKDSGCGKDGGKNVERIVQCVKMIVWKRHETESAVCGNDS